MSIDSFVSRNWFACLLVALHTLLVGAYGWIELDGAFDIALHMTMTATTVNSARAMNAY